MPKMTAGFRGKVPKTMAASDPDKPGAASASAGSPASRTRILLADDHPLVRRGVALGLAQHPNLEIVGDAADGEEALRKVRELLPELVLMDIDLPRINGLALTELLRKELPRIKV